VDEDLFGFRTNNEGNKFGPKNPRKIFNSMSLNKIEKQKECSEGN
jgi:hypothetical protein